MVYESWRRDRESQGKGPAERRASRRPPTARRKEKLMFREKAKTGEEEKAVKPLVSCVICVRAGVGPAAGGSEDSSVVKVSVCGSTAKDKSGKPDSECVSVVPRRQARAAKCKRGRKETEKGRGEESKQRRAR